jgi:hypothetical protein
MVDLALIELVSSNLCRQFKKTHPNAKVSYKIIGDRGIITIIEDGHKDGYEFIESMESFAEIDSHCKEYSDLLKQEHYVGIVVPKVAVHIMDMKASDIQRNSGTRPLVAFYDADGIAKDPKTKEPIE